MIGDCQVPSQPMLEWIALKVLGAARLLTRVMDHCSRAFVYPSGLESPHLGCIVYACICI